MKKAIVTGGNGFIGSNLIKFLLDKKYYQQLQESNIALSKSLSWKNQSSILLQSMGLK